MKTNQKIEVSSYDLVLLGNISIDEVYELEDSSQIKPLLTDIGILGIFLKKIKNLPLKSHIITSIGCDQEGRVISDFIKGLNTVSLVNSSESPTSRRIVFKNKNNFEQSVFESWSCAKDSLNPIPFQSNWMHISYLDVIGVSKNDMADYRKWSNIISATANNFDGLIKLTALLEYIDYIFLSETELDKIPKQHPINEYQRKFVVFQSLFKDKELIQQKELFSTEFVLNRIIHPDKDIEDVLRLIKDSVLLANKNKEINY